MSKKVEKLVKTVFVYDDEHERREKLGLPHGVHEMDEDLILKYLEKVA